jgi:NADPH2:quinone reductase
VVSRHGGPDVLEVAHTAVVDPGPGELQIEVAAAGVNFIDVYQREGVYPVPTPFVLGLEGAGVVRAVGSGVSEFGVGESVAWPHSRGSASAFVTLPADAAVPVPNGVDLDVAAAVMLQGLTAHYLVNSVYPVAAGEVILVHAAAGGVGQLLIQLAKAKGATVIGTVSTEAKAATARGVGADHVINYSEVRDLASAVRELTPAGAGVSVVYDGVGASTFDASLASLRKRGMLALFGGASGQVPPFDIQRLNHAGSLFLTRPTLSDYIATRTELLERSVEILSAIAAGSVSVQIGGRYQLAEAARAYEDLEGRRSIGKLLLIP